MHNYAKGEKVKSFPLFSGIDLCYSFLQTNSETIETICMPDGD